jgi:hypothetical protein
MEGSLTANGERLGARDAAQVVGSDAAATRLQVGVLEEGAHFMIIEMEKRA